MLVQSKILSLLWIKDKQVNLNEMSSTNAPVALKSGETGSLKTDPAQQITSTSQGCSRGWLICKWC